MIKFLTLTEIDAGEFNENFQFFVYIDEDGSIFMVKDYSKLVKVVQISKSFQINFSFSIEKVFFKQLDGSFVLINLGHNKIERAADKVRKLYKSLKYSKRAILISCLNTNCLRL